ncbi:MAG TPA: alpha/beta hydrolase [Acidimicrobiia bacterium]|nr:alpha/beta hydrolase [Acidimicrobiia bacterium]
MEAVEIDGLRVAYRRHGTGPTLVLLHGAVCDSRAWRAEIDAFAAEYDVVAWDAPGCGGSSDPPDDFRMPDYARCLDGLLRALEIELPHVLGHSWGSGLALDLYRQRPNEVRSLVLVGGYAGWAGSLDPDEVERRLAFALDAAQRPAGSFVPSSMPGLFTDLIPPARAEELATIMADSRPGGTRTMAIAFAESDLRDLLPDVAVPTLVLAGDADERSPLPVANALHAALPNSTLTVLPGLGHECFLEAPERVHAAIRTFLASTRD